MVSKLFASALVVGLPMSAIAATPGARPDDDAMTCAMIGQEMQPGAMAMSGAMAPDMARIKQRGDRVAKEGKVEMAKQTALSAGCVAGAIASMGMVDPCAAVVAAQEAEERVKAPKRAAEAAAMNADMGSMMAAMNRSMAGMDMVRMKRLMALAEAKNCREP
jgi:hypothetical protein